jgi:lipopolysaccharide/colanic/teichoic acid biosynthesis glycosyltransferase
VTSLSCASAVSVLHSPPRCARARALVKDLIERPLALLGVVLLLPLFGLLALLVRASGPGPILHRRRVVGQYGREFDAFKFRTMVTDADARLAADQELQRRFQVNHKLEQDPRITGIGRILRRYSLDELPQLFNVVAGDMWLIGPRMITAPELERYGTHAPKLLSVKPGLTGLWQVSGRQKTTYDRRVELDMQYIDNWSVKADLAILARTVSVVLRAEGAF